MKKILPIVLFLLICACGGGVNCGTYFTTQEIVGVLNVLENTCGFETSASLTVKQTGCDAEVTGIANQVLTGTVDQWGFIEVRFDSGGSSYYCTLRSPVDQLDYSMLCHDSASIGNSCYVNLDYIENLSGAGA